MKKLILLAVAVCTIVAACKKSSVDNTAHNQFVGQWNWSLTVNEGSPSSVTPGAAGYTETLSLNANNTYVISRNGAIRERGQYCIFKDASSTPAQPIYRIKFAYQNDEQIISLMNAKTIALRKPAVSQVLYERAE